MVGAPGRAAGAPRGSLRPKSGSCRRPRQRARQQRPPLQRPKRNCDLSMKPSASHGLPGPTIRAANSRRRGLMNVATWNGVGRLRAALDLRGANAACVAIQGRLAGLQAPKFAGLGPQIYACRVGKRDGRGSEDRETNSHFTQSYERGTYPATRPSCRALRGKKRQRQAAATKHLRCASKKPLGFVEGLKEPPPAPNWGVTLEHTAAWRAALR